MRSILHGRPTRRSRAAFSLVEVMVAAGIMAAGITSTLIALQMGIGMYENARSADIAVQALEDEAERLRLLNWAELKALPDEANFDMPTYLIDAKTDPDRFTFHRKIEDLNGSDAAKRIRLHVEWHSMKGRHQERMLYLIYTEGGLYDYFYGSA